MEHGKISLFVTFCIIYGIGQPCRAAGDSDPKCDLAKDDQSKYCCPLDKCQKFVCENKCDKFLSDEKKECDSFLGSPCCTLKEHGIGFGCPDKGFLCTPASCPHCELLNSETDINVNDKSFDTYSHKYCCAKEGPCKEELKFSCNEKACEDCGRLTTDYNTNLEKAKLGQAHLDCCKLGDECNPVGEFKCTDKYACLYCENKCTSYEDAEGKKKCEQAQKDCCKMGAGEPCSKIMESMTKEFNCNAGNVCEDCNKDCSKIMEEIEKERCAYSKEHCCKGEGGKCKLSSSDANETTSTTSVAAKGTKQTLSWWMISLFFLILCLSDDY